MKKESRFNLNKIVNIRSLAELAVYDEQLRSHAIMLAKNDSNLGEDSLHDVYLNLHKYLTKYPDKVINGGLVSVAIRNTIRNAQKKSNRMDFESSGSIIAYTLAADSSTDDLEKFLQYEVLREELELRLEDIESDNNKQFLMYCLSTNIKAASAKYNMPYNAGRELYKSLIKELRGKGVVEDFMTEERLDEVHTKYIESESEHKNQYYIY